MSADARSSEPPLRVSLRSDVGRTRTENQDRCESFHRRDGATLIVVADGMGGHRGGATAAQMAIEHFGETFTSADTTAGDELLREGVASANREIWKAAEADPDLGGMGSTLVAMLLSGSENWLVHVGDSRAYLFRDGRLERLTEDHSTVMELVRSGRILPEEAETHPRKNEVLRSLGLPDGVEPEIQSIAPIAGDRFLLCSDGLTGVVSDEELAYLLGRHDGEEAVEILIDAANAAGGPDNVTVAIVEFPRIEGGLTDDSASRPDAIPLGVASEEARDPNDEKARLDPFAELPRPSPNSPGVKRLLLIAIVTAILLILMLALFIMSSLMRGSDTPLDASNRMLSSSVRERPANGSARVRDTPIESHGLPSDELPRS